MDRRVTPPKRVTSPTWGPPPPCKQALNWDFKIQRREQRRKRHKNNRFYNQNNNFARASRSFVHFFTRFCTTTT